MKVFFFVLAAFIDVFPLNIFCQELGFAEIPACYQAKISVLTQSLKKKGRTELQQTKILFHKAHRDFLKKYKAYSSLNDVFAKGNYDCLSGTYFLSIALTELGIKHRIIETNYHIFLIAETGQGEVLLESTDRYDGFIQQREKIEERISNYQMKTRVGNEQLYLSHIKIYHEVLQEQLSGLIYFNQAVESYHKNDLEASCRYLKNAWGIYDNPRIEEFIPILIYSLLNSKLDERVKEDLTTQLRIHQRYSPYSVAAK